MLKLFGTPSKGLGASDQDSIEVYNAMIESEIRNKIKYQILRMLEIKCQKIFSYVPDDLAITFKPLRVLSAVDEETVKTQKFARAIQAIQLGQISTLEFKNICNKGNLFDISLETTTDGINPDSNEEGDEAAEGLQDPDKPKDTDDPGANRLDTRKARATEVGGAGKEPPAPKSADVPRAKAQAIDSPDESGDPVKRLKNAEFQNPGKVNEALWAKAKKRAKAAGGGWALVTWIYKKMGGTFE